ncbi:unnamed protein product [Closterium sp. Naga37s-1]|nr:unnamed protein product [Closterium sp. Naga37s-1]
MRGFYCRRNNQLHVKGGFKSTLPCSLQSRPLLHPHTLRHFPPHPPPLPYSLCSPILPSLLHPPPRSLPHLPTSSFLFTPPHPSPPLLTPPSHDGLLQCPANSSTGDLFLPALEAGAVAAGTVPLPLFTTVHPSAPLRNPLRHDGILQCPADNSTGDLFLPALEAGTVAAGTVPWHTTRGKFLLLHCVRGQVGTGEGWCQPGQLQVLKGRHRALRAGGYWERWVLGTVGAGEGGYWLVLGKVGGCCFPNLLSLPPLSLPSAPSSFLSSFQSLTPATPHPLCSTLPFQQISYRVLRIKNHLLLAALFSRTLIVPSPLPPPLLLPPSPTPITDQQPGAVHKERAARSSCPFTTQSNRVLCIKNHLLLAGLLSRTLIVPFHHSEVISNRVLCIKNHLLVAGLLSRTLIVPFHHSEVISNRVLCIKNHLLLAGLLSRTLIVPFHHSEVISNRVLCIKNHLLLAGLLSRTLIVPFHHSEVVRNYNMHVALDVEHLRRCFGKVVFTTAEYRRKYVKPINVTEVVCWHGPKGACREEDKELLLNCPAPETMNTPASVLVGGDGEALRKIGKPGFVFNTRVRITRTLFRGQLTRLTGNHTALAACLPMAATKSQVLEAYGNNQSPVLVVGDLVNIHFTEWPESDAALDLPFERSSDCPTALLIKPAAAMFFAAELFVRETFQRERFVGMHWRRGDFKAYCFWHGPKNACYFPVQQVAYWVYRKMRELGINNLFLATNAKHAELEELTVLLN